LAAQIPPPPRVCALLLKKSEIVHLSSLFFGYWLKTQRPGRRPH
jgi:hypothetical protein